MKITLLLLSFAAFYLFACWLASKQPDLPEPPKPPTPEEMNGQGLTKPRSG